MDKKHELFQDLKNAQQKLKQALELPETEINRDATIQRFEFTFELTWKLLNLFIRESGIEVYGPKNTLREAEKLELIQDIDVWFDFLYARNLTTHTYQEETAKEAFSG